MKRLVLVDGTAIAYRSFFAIPGSFQTSAGVLTNATYGFARMFHKLFGKKRPDYGVVAFDPGGPTFRSERFAEYKAQRPKMPSELRSQLRWIEDVVEANGFPSVRVDGYEADDVIGTLTRLGREAGLEVWIVSGDKDFAQLVGENVRMVDPVKDVHYDTELVRKKWGVLPERFVDYLALVGDKADNIPGVPGIGAKTAMKLLDQFGDLDAILAGAETLKGKQRERLIDFADDARMSRELATIDQYVKLPLSLESCELEPLERERVDALYEELEFYSLLSKERGTEALESENAALLESDEAAAKWLSEASGPVAMSLVFDGSPTPGTAAFVGLGFHHGSAAAYAPSSAVGESVRAWLSADHPKIVHDLREQLVVFGLTLGAKLQGVVADVRLASFLLDPSGDIPHRLDQIARTWIQQPIADEKSILGSGKSKIRFADAERQAVADYAAMRARVIHQSWEAMAGTLVDEEQDRFMRETAMPLSGVLARMQNDGVRVSAEHLRRLGSEFETRRDELEKEVHKLAGREFNLASGKQLGAVLFDELKLPVLKKTKTGYSTAADVLERLAPEHPIAELIVRWRALAKLVNTYTRVLREAIAEDGRIHCSFQQTTGASGRLITTDPDLQRTPIRTEDGRRIREAFIPREGWTFVSADFSQIELRIMAHLSEDATLIDALSGDRDVHTETAARIYDVSPEDVTREQRNTGKTVNFATLYGQGATALGRSLGIPRKEAKEMIERYFETYPGVRRWLDRTIGHAHSEGYVTTMLGRRRHIPELQSNNFADRGYGERVAANTPIQGSAADLCKLAMLGIDRRIRDAGLQAIMMVQIHDELLFESPPEELDQLLAIVREEMESAMPLSVPLIVDIGHGTSWAEAH